MGALRFENAPIAWSVDDTRDTTEPEGRPFARNYYYLNAYLLRYLTRLMDVPEPTRANNTNALDEVPDSTWFENRMGVRDLTVQDIRRGPNTDEAGPVRPWTIKGTKVGGRSPGFLIKDARGVKYLLKFDERGVPDLETGADVVVQRLLWAIGFHVPEDEIVTFRREDLTIAPDATVEDVFGAKSPMTAQHVDEVFALIEQRPDGTWRGLTSKFLPGVPIGGYAQEGTRDDDPNDMLPHEDRRELRAQYVFFGWLSHSDIKEDNWLDMWVENPNRPGEHYVKHFLVDFGKSLGVMGFMANSPPESHAYVIDYEYIALSALALGFWQRPWEGVVGPGIPGVGRFEAEHFDPTGYKPRNPFIPFMRMDRFDGFWGAKIVMRFTPELLRAAVEQGHYSDPRAVEWLVQTLQERQRRIGAYWFRQVNPLDGFRVEAGADGAAAALCFDDLLIRHGIEDVAAATRYDARTYDAAGAATGFAATAAPDARGAACIDGLPLAAGDPDGYTIVEVATLRGQDLAPVLVHLARDPATRRPRVIGLRRQ